MVGEFRGDPVDGTERSEAWLAKILFGKFFDCGGQIIVLALLAVAEIDDDDAFAHEMGLKSGFNASDELERSAGGIVRGNADKKVDFTNAHELTKEVIC